MYVFMWMRIICTEERGDDWQALAHANNVPVQIAYG